MTDDSVHAANGRQVTSVRFANAALGNIGASLSLAGDEHSEDGDDAGPNPVDATLDEIVNNPLAIRLEADIRRMNPADPSSVKTDIAAEELKDTCRIQCNSTNDRILEWVSLYEDAKIPAEPY